MKHDRVVGSCSKVEHGCSDNTLQRRERLKQERMQNSLGTVSTANGRRTSMDACCWPVCLFIQDRVRVCTPSPQPTLHSPHVDALSWYCVATVRI
jgi:hypothetical protein